MDVFYFHAHYGYEGESWEEHDEYGFLLARDFVCAMEQITEYYRDDLMGIEIHCIGDSGMISVENKEIAEAFKKSFVKTHYGEEE